MQIDVFRADANITEQKNCSIYLYGDLVVKHVGERFVNKKILRFKSYLLTFKNNIFTQKEALICISSVV